MEHGYIHLYIVALSQIKKDCEITIPHDTRSLRGVLLASTPCACGLQECLNNVPLKNGLNLKPGRR